jgi:putative hemolysin
VLFLLLVCTGLGFITMLESALYSVRKTLLKIKSEDGNKRYKKALKTAEHPEIFVSALRLCNIFLGVLAGVIEALFIFPGLRAGQAPLWEVSGIVVFAVIALTAITGFLTGNIFKQIALYMPEKIVIDFLPFIRGAAFLCKPFFIVNAFFSPLFRKIFHTQESVQELASGMTEAELRIALQEGEKSGIVESAERTMVEGVFYLGDRPAGTFMTHRSEIAWLDTNASLDGIMKTVTEFRSQRYFPVAENTLDEVTGVVSVEDILFALTSDPRLKLKSIVKPPHFVPETMSALKVIEVFKQKEVDFLFVMDEYGGFAGILSLNDLVEEIVGQLSADSAETESIVRQGDGSFLVDGSNNIDEIAELLSLPSLIDEHQEYHTLAGFILSLAGEIPRTGASFDYKNLEFKIVDMDGNRIDKVIITPKAVL